MVSGGVMGDFHAFRDRVQHDAGLQAQLLDIDDQTEFVAAVFNLGIDLGYEFSDDDVTSAMQRGRRAWIERGLA
jgi:hypothetical protein